MSNFKEQLKALRMARASKDAEINETDADAPLKEKAWLNIAKQKAVSFWQSFKNKLNIARFKRTLRLRRIFALRKAKHFIFTFKRDFKLKLANCVASLKASAKNITLLAIKKICLFIYLMGLFFIAVYKKGKRQIREKTKVIMAFDRAHSRFLAPLSLSLVIVLAGTYTLNSYTLGLKVYYDGEPIASVSNESEFNDYMRSFNANISKELGQPFYSEIPFSYNLALLKKDDISISSDLEQKLIEATPNIRVMSVLKVDGKIIGANDSGEAIEQVLEEIKAPYLTGEEGLVVEFDKPVSIERRLSFTDIYRDVADIKAVLEAPAKLEQVYIIEKGDTISQIAPRYQMSAAALVALNADKEPTAYKPGDELVVSQEVNYLSVVTRKTIEYTEEIAYSSEKENSDSLYTTQKKVKIQGVPGEKTIKAEIVSVNGVETERRIISSDITRQPVNEIILVGTKKPPEGTATGVLKMPASGKFTSYYGYRGREFHTGLDIANNRGTAIYAADGGKVTFAGWKGTYGNCIIIDHGNGMSTLYAHCSELYVSQGSSVAKGAHIAAMGSTGRSTGNHLHFEVRINGNHQNPLSYLR